MIRSARQFRIAFGMHLKQAMHHPYAALVVMVSWVLRIGLTIIFYRAIYAILHTGNIRGIAFNAATSSMVLYALFMGIGVRQMNEVINSDYATGSIALWSNKPVPYILLKVSEVLGKNVPTALGISGCIAMFWFLGGFPDVEDTGLRFLAGGVLLFLGLLIGFFLYSLLGLTVLWLGDSSGPFMIVDKMVMLFGGCYIPVAFFPGTLRLIGESLPMGSMASVSQIFFPDFFANLPRFLAVQVIWILLLGAMLFWANRRASQHLTVNGG